MHFGLYLKKKGIISAQQLVDALEAQLHALVPIGQLALEDGILSARDIFEILRSQSETPHVRFGELAIELRLMTRDQLMRLLMVQADRKRPLSDILIWQGVLTDRQVATELAEYRRAQMQPKHTVTRIRPMPPKRPTNLRTTRPAEPAITT